MLAFEWQELEKLGERLRVLHHRYAAAQRTAHVGLVEGLKRDLTQAQQQRDRLLRYIQVCYRVAPGERNRASREWRRLRRAVAARSGIAPQRVRW
ncbi:MAG TPA: hypothetical protein VGQ90_09080 [Stellaceae bacterium]|nr:hypothetical protein [Stellaceae bacterium]